MRGARKPNDKKDGQVFRTVRVDASASSRNIRTLNRIERFQLRMTEIFDPALSRIGMGIAELK